MRITVDDQLAALLKRDTPPSYDDCRGMDKRVVHDLIVRWLERQLRREVEKIRAELGLWEADEGRSGSATYTVEADKT